MGPTSPLQVVQVRRRYTKAVDGVSAFGTEGPRPGGEGLMESDARDRHIWAVRARLALSCVAPVVLILLLIWHRRTVDAGTDAMGRADREWLLTAGLAVLGTWVGGTCCQLGATLAVLPVGRVFATQVAGSFVNHVLPAGAGIAALNLRMLRKAGLSLSGAAGAVGLNAAAGFVVHALALIGLLFITGPHVDHFDRSRLYLIAAGAIVVMAGGVLIIERLRRRPGRWGDRIRNLLTASTGVLTRPRRAIMLWAGSAAVPACHIMVLIAVLRALHDPVPVLTLAVVYLGASALAAVIPSPGGFGALDVTLLATLTGAGVSAAAAAASVIGYRLLTVWLPLVPGAATLLLLLHRRIV